MMPIPKQEIAAIVQQFYFGENDGAKLIHELPAFAPGEHEITFCGYWEQDEQKHDRLFHEILPLYGVKPEGFNELFSGLFGIAWGCVKEKDWVKCMAISAVIENIALTAGEYLYEQGDAPVKNVLEQILPDEKKHLGFSQQQLELAIKNDETNRQKVKDVLKRVKYLSCEIGKEGLFTVHDIAVSNRAEEKFLNDVKSLGIRTIRIKNTNGYVRNWFVEKMLLPLF